MTRCTFCGHAADEHDPRPKAARVCELDCDACAHALAGDRTYTDALATFAAEYADAIAADVRRAMLAGVRIA